MNYEKKYLKYKNKYIQLNNQIGGTLEEDEADEINRAFLDLSVYNSTNVYKINNIIYMCAILNLYKKENFSLLFQAIIIQHLLRYLTNYSKLNRTHEVVNIINDHYLFLLETLIVTINNSNPDIQYGNFFNSDMNSFLIFINNSKNSFLYINLTLKLINAIIDKMSIIDNCLYKSVSADNFLFIILVIIFLENNISEIKTKYSITKVKEFIKKLKCEKKLFTHLSINKDGEKLIFPLTDTFISDLLKNFNATKLDIHKILQNYFE